MKHKKEYVIYILFYALVFVNFAALYILDVF